MHTVLIYNPILSHKGSKSTKIVQLPKITQNQKIFSVFFVQFYSFLFFFKNLNHSFPSPTPKSHNIRIVGKGASRIQRKQNINGCKKGWNNITKSSTDCTQIIPLLVDAKRGLRSINHSLFFKMSPSYSDAIRAQRGLS